MAIGELNDGVVLYQEMGKQREQGGLIYPSLCNSNVELPFNGLHTDRLSDRHSEA